MPILEQDRRSGETTAPPPPPPETNDTSSSGGGDSGTAPPSPDSTESSPPVGSEAIREYVLNNYGYLAWAMDDPELGPILLEAAADNWGEQELFAAIIETNWWQNNEQSVRNFQRLQHEDPATLNAQIAEAELSLRIMARRQGINISPQRLKDLATESIKLQWDQAEMQRAVALEARFNPDTPLAGGDLDATQRQLSALASQWLVPLSDRSTFEWAKAITLGEASAEGFQSYLAQQAESRFPHLAEQFRAGISPGSYFEPYRQTISQMLEVPVTMVDIVNDPKWSPVLNHVGEDGKPRAMTISELQRHVRRQPEWKRTKNAVEQAAQLVQFIGQRFGSTT